MKQRILVFALSILSIVNCSNDERDACIKKCDTQNFTLLAISESNNASACQNRNSIFNQTYDECLSQRRRESITPITRITTSCKDSCYEKAKLY